MREPAPPKRRSTNAFALRSCLYSTSSVFSRCSKPRLRQPKCLTALSMGSNP